jgi:hypothetical protein
MRVIAKAILKAVDVGRDVTTTELFTAHFARGPARVVEDAPRRLVVAGVPVAMIGPDPSRLNPMCATSAEDMPVVEMLSAIAAQDPTGVLVIESADAQQGFAFEIVGGKVTGARGPGNLGQVERWCAEVHRCYPDRFGTGDRTDPLWIAVARAFVTERVLDHLELANGPGSRLTFVRGDVSWNGTRLPEGKGVSLQHLLLEHARRSDELPRILNRLGDSSQLAVPLSEPSYKPTPAPKQKGRVDDGWDFFDDPDPAALEEWGDARLVWPLCDGQHSIEEIVELALLGRFRGLAALAALRDRSHIMVVDAAPIGEMDLDDPQYDEPKASAPVVPLRRLAPPPPAPEEQRTEYSVVHKTTRGTNLRDTIAKAPKVPAVRSTPRMPETTRRPTPRADASSSRMPRVNAMPARRPTPRTVEPTRAPLPLVDPDPIDDVDSRRLSARKRDVVDEMLADLITSPDDEPAFAAPLPEPPRAAKATTPSTGRKPPRRGAMKVVAMAIMGATLFVAGAGVALHVSRTHAVAIER